MRAVSMHVHHAIVGVPCVDVVIGVVLGELHVVRVVPVLVCDAVVLIHFVLIALYRSHCFHRRVSVAIFCIWRFCVYKLSSKHRTNRAIGKSRRRWEDDINEFLKLEENETQNSIERNNQFNKSWNNAARDRGRWTLYSNDCTMTAEERYESNARARRITQSRPARYVNGARLSDDEVPNIT